jgi:hypothetical protein
MPLPVNETDVSDWGNMSEEGWRAFLGADGLEDWVVLHGGAAVAYDVAR